MVGVPSDNGGRLHFVILQVDAVDGTYLALKSGTFDTTFEEAETVRLCSGVVLASFLMLSLAWHDMAWRGRMGLALTIRDCEEEKGYPPGNVPTWA